ncbi:MAG: dNTP triphosphohydrolase [Oscillospiraceae bacterium]|nr:dNTP triphosphohydrolase [Oscillospiraceae bacterium]
MQWAQLLSKKHFQETTDTPVIYENDYDTIICSTLFRRLQDKAQVFPLDDDDYVRTRLTHSLEVSAIGKRIGEYVFHQLKNREVDHWFEEHSEKEFSDVLLCAGLVHDIGNPPFGHFGEYAIREWFSNHLSQLSPGGTKVSDILTEWQLQDFYCFEGNAQSLRLLSKTPYLGRTNGFNLSYSVLGSIIKYPVSSAELKSRTSNRYKKIGYHYAERVLFEDIQSSMGLNGNRHPLSYLLEAADDIAYRTSDLEDAMVKKVISFHQIVGAFEQNDILFDEQGVDQSQVEKHVHQLKTFYQQELRRNGQKPELTAVQRWNRYLQGIMVQDAGNAFMKHYDDIMDGRFHGDLFDHTVSGCIIQVIAQLSERLIYTSSIKTRPELFGRRVIDSLLTQFMPAAIVYDTGESATFIERRTIDTISEFYKSMYRSESLGKSEQEKLYLRILMVTDYISGMTDNYAKKLYQELFV